MHDTGAKSWEVQASGGRCKGQRKDEISGNTCIVQKELLVVQFQCTKNMKKVLNIMYSNVDSLLNKKHELETSGQGILLNGRIGTSQRMDFKGGFNVTTSQACCSVPLLQLLSFLASWNAGVMIFHPMLFSGPGPDNSQKLSSGGPGPASNAWFLGLITISPQTVSRSV